MLCVSACVHVHGLHRDFRPMLDIQFSMITHDDGLQSTNHFASNHNILLIYNLQCYRCVLHCTHTCGRPKLLSTASRYIILLHLDFRIIGIYLIAKALKASTAIIGLPYRNNRCGRMCTESGSSSRTYTHTHTYTNALALTRTLTLVHRLLTSDCICSAIYRSKSINTFTCAYALHTQHILQSVVNIMCIRVAQVSRPKCIFPSMTHTHTARAEQSWTGHTEGQTLGHSVGYPCSDCISFSFTRPSNNQFTGDAPFSLWSSNTTDDDGSMQTMWTRKQLIFCNLFIYRCIQHTHTFT